MNVEYDTHSNAIYCHFTHILIVCMSPFNDAVSNGDTAGGVATMAFLFLFAFDDCLLYLARILLSSSVRFIDY